MSWILDVLFFVLIIFGILLGVRQGFIAGICKLAGTILAVAVAILFCNSFADALGLTDALVSAIGNAEIGGWIAVAIAFLILIVLTKMGAWLLGKLGTALAEKIKPFALVNNLCGGILGLFKALILIFLLLAACYWLNEWLHLAPLADFINGSSIVGAIFQWDWFIEIAHFKFVIPS
ncbi:MAG: CvpA family protein [Clostridia bacterium]|nr:CvpA family protein [Clostridia bacterium]